MTLAIIGPLLRPGTVLLLDWVPAPRPELSTQFWGFPPGPPNGAPVEVIRWLFDHIVPWGVGRLLPLAIAPTLAAWGLRRLLRPVTDSALVILASTVFLIINPFMYDRMLAGHLYLVDGVALLPLLLSFLSDAPGLQSAVRVGLTFAMLVGLSLHFVFIAGVLLLSYVIASVIAREWRNAFTPAVGAAATVALSLYWIIPAMIGRVPSLSLSTAHLDAFKTTSDGTFGLLPNVLGLYGFWRSEWPLSKTNFRLWPLLLVVILLVCGVGFRDLLRRPQLRVAVLSVAIASLVGVLLSLGAQGPTGWLFRFLFEHLPGFAVMREPQKFLALLVVGYASMFGWGVKILAEHATTQRAAIGVVVLLMVLPVVYGYKQLWGFGAFLKPSRYPASWAEADHEMGPGQGRVLVLPWHQYLAVPFASGRIVANPAGNYFQRQTIVSDDPEVPGIQGVATDDIHRYVDRLVRERDEHFARSIAPLGAEYVLIMKYVDHRSYDWVRQAEGLVRVREWHDLALYRNRAYSGTLGSNNARAIRVVRRSPIRYEVLDASERGPLVAALVPITGWTYRNVTSRPTVSGLQSLFPVSVSPGPILYSGWNATRASYGLGLAELLTVALLCWFARGRVARSLRS